MTLRQLFCSHRVYLTDLHRFSDNCVAGLCHKCEAVLTAEYGAKLPLDGDRPKRCETCNGTGQVEP